MDDAANNAAISTIEGRLRTLDAIRNSDQASKAAKDSAQAKTAELDEELKLRESFRDASPQKKRAAEKALADYRRRRCPSADESTLVESCKPKILRVHLHMRFLLPEALLKDLRDAAKYPLRAANVSQAMFDEYYAMKGKGLTAKTRWRSLRAVPEVTVKLAGVEQKTQNGVATFKDVPAGRHTIEVFPAASEESTAPAGPVTPTATNYDYATAPEYMFRRFTVTAEVTAEGDWTLPQQPAITMTTTTPPAYANFVDITLNDLYLDWKPDWLKLKNRREGTAADALTCVVMHQTVTIPHENMGSPINTFQGGGDSSHYLVDLDGHVVKFVHEDDRSGHAHPLSDWKDFHNLNAHGVGIEIVHSDYNGTIQVPGPVKHREFTREQYDAVNRIVGDLFAKYAMTRHFVCGHNDCKGVSKECPGDMFDWKQLEDAAHARKPIDASPYTGSKDVDPNETVSSRSKHELTKQLHEIGYTNKTVKVAVDRFIVHYFSGSRYDPKRLTGDTAIQSVPQPTPNSPNAPAPPVNPRKAPAKAAPPPKQIVQEIADLIDQVYRDK